MSDRRVGIPLATAREQLQKTPPESTVPARPLPPGQPLSVASRALGIVEGKPLRFNVIGDSGGVKTPWPQLAVCAAMAEDADRPSFLWHVGDVVYFGSDADQWGAQFYEPNAHLPYPILGNPGNHDDDRGGDPPFDSSRGPLDQWLLNFCAKAPGVPAADPHNEFGRDTMTQPYCDWVLAADAMTLISFWSNVPSGGHLYQAQTDWLAEQLKAAPQDRPLIVSLHHPPLSIDAHHGGSQRMGAALDGAFQAAGRAPQLILTGHVHNAQFFTRAFSEDQIAYVVLGNSGYHHLHKLAPGVSDGEYVDAEQTIRFDYGDDSRYGYLKVTVDGMTIAGEYVAVETDAMGNATATPGAYKFEVGP